MKLNYRRTILIGMAFLSISAFWQMYDNVIPLILKNTFGMGETITGAIMAADNVLALFLLPIFGTLSDKVKTPIGKRMQFIVTGTALAFIFLMILPIADRTENLVLFVGGLFILLISMGTYRSPAVALMPDLTPKPLRSKANAVINLMGAVGGVFTLVMIKIMVGAGDRPNYFPLFLAVGLFMVGSITLLFFTIKENKLDKKLEKRRKRCGKQQPRNQQNCQKKCERVWCSSFFRWRSGLLHTMRLPRHFHVTPLTYGNWKAAAMQTVF